MFQRRCYSMLTVRPESTCALQVELGSAKKAAELTTADTPGSTPSTGASSRRCAPTWILTSCLHACTGILYLASVLTRGCCALMLLEHRRVLHHDLQQGYRPVSDFTVTSAAHDRRKAGGPVSNRSAWPWMALQTGGCHAVSLGACDCIYALRVAMQEAQGWRRISL